MFYNLQQRQGQRRVWHRSAYAAGSGAGLKLTWSSALRPEIKTKRSSQLPEAKGVWGRSPHPAANEFLRFSHKKNSFWHTFLSEKGMQWCSHYKQCKNIFAAYVLKQKLG